MHTSLPALSSCILALVSANCTSDSMQAKAASAPHTDRLASATSGQKDLCSLFTPGEIAKLLGTPVGGGGVAALGSGCQWDSLNDDDPYFAQIQVLADTSYWQDFKLAPKYEPIQGVGIKAYSLPDDEGGWRASALTDRVSMVRLVATTANRSNTVTFLRQLLDRNR